MLTTKKIDVLYSKRAQIFRHHKVWKIKVHLQKKIKKFPNQKLKVAALLLNFVPLNHLYPLAYWATIIILQKWQRKTDSSANKNLIKNFFFFHCILICLYLVKPIKKVEDFPGGNNVFQITKKMCYNLLQLNKTKVCVCVLYPFLFRIYTHKTGH